MILIYSIYSIFIFLFGLCIGSFLNCVIFRLEKNKGLNGRSFCPQCRRTLSWPDLFPVFSFLFLRGKCRYCNKKIFIQYPVVEISTAILFVLIFWSLGFGRPLVIGIWDLINLVFLFYVASSLIVIFVYDLKHYLILDAVLLPAIIIAILYRALTNFPEVLNYLLAILIASGFFFLIWFVSRGKWMGFGDVKLAVLLGLMTGFPNILVVLYSAFFFGSIIGIILMLRGKKKLKSEIPFGPFLITGTFIALFWGEKIIQWYLQIFQI